MAEATGDGKLVAEIMADAQALLDGAAGEEEQLNLLDPVSPEDIAEAREELGADAGRLTVLRRAREKRGRGRPVGSRNRRTDDLEKYLLQFGHHPAITLMQLQATPEEVLVETSAQRKVHSFRKDGTENVVIERMSFEAARSLRVRCAEALMPYFVSKKPIAVDARIMGITVVEQFGDMRDGGAIDGEFVEVAGDDLGEAAK